MVDLAVALVEQALEDQNRYERRNGVGQDEERAVNVATTQRGPLQQAGQHHAQEKRDGHGEQRKCDVPPENLQEWRADGRVAENLPEVFRTNPHPPAGADGFAGSRVHIVAARRIGAQGLAAGHVHQRFAILAPEWHAVAQRAQADQTQWHRFSRRGKARVVQPRPRGNHFPNAHCGRGGRQDVQGQRHRLTGRGFRRREGAGDQQVATDFAVAHGYHNLVAAGLGSRMQTEVITRGIRCVPVLREPRADLFLPQQMLTAKIGEGDIHRVH